LCTDCSGPRSGENGCGKYDSDDEH
jgi:hypothetical protein